MRRKIFILLLIIGFILRLAGLFFDGNHNYDSYKEVGQLVRNLGLADGYTPGYGPISQLIMGLCDYFVQFTPHIWWFPYKTANFIFECAILFFLLKLLKKYPFEVVILYWLNPWFLIPGAWQGFWDAGLGFFILLTAFILDFRKDNGKNYFLAGLFLGIAFCIKPQVLAVLAVLGIYFLIFHIVRFRFKEMLCFALGFAFLPMIFNFYFFLNAKGTLYFFQVFYVTISAMPNLVNSEINIWHTVSYIIMSFNHMKGPIYSLSTTYYPYNLMERGAQVFFFLLLIIYMFRVYLQKLDRSRYFFTKAFAFSLLLMPQILTRSHVYHLYSATLLMIPLIITEKEKNLFIFWAITIFIHFCNISGYGLGRSISYNPLVPSFWHEPIISFMGIVQFIATFGLVYTFMFPTKKILSNYAKNY